MPTIWTLLAAYFLCTLINAGISSRQGAHQVAQKFTTSTLPRQWESGCGLPLRSSSDAVISLWAALSAAGGIRFARLKKKPARPASAAATRNTLAWSGLFTARDQGPDRIQAGALESPTQWRSLHGATFVARPVNSDPDRRALPIQGQHAYCALLTPAVMPQFRGLIRNVAVQQKNLQVFADVGVAPGGALQHRAGEIGLEIRKLFHRRQRLAAQKADALALLFALV